MIRDDGLGGEYRGDVFGCEEVLAGWGD